MAEYSMVIGLIAVFSIGMVMATGTTVGTVFCETAAKLNYKVNGAADGVSCTLGETDLSGELPPRVIIPDTYEPVSENMLLVYEGSTASFRLTATGGTIDWGDGTQDTINAGTKTYSHYYSGAQRWRVNIDGTATAFQNTDYAGLREVISFGTVGLQSLNKAFAQTGGLTKVAALPDTVTDLTEAFAGAAIVPQQVEAWNISNVTSASGLFDGAAEFRADIAYWDVSGIADFSNMFRNVLEFNEDIAAWNMASATTLDGMFQGGMAFNVDISGWDTSNVTSMVGTFSGTEVFDQPIGAWDVSSVDSFRSMFEGASSFNQPLNDWDVSGAVRIQSAASYSFNSMFKNALAFNQPLAAWDVSGVEDYFATRNGQQATQNFGSMFEGAASFAQSLVSWCVDAHESGPANFSAGSLMVSEPIWGECGTPDYDNGILLAYRGGEEVTIALGGKASIDWGDGSFHSTGTSASATHLLPEGERVLVKIAGSAASLQAGGDALLEVVSFGEVPLTSLASAFVDTANLEKVAPLPATVTNLSSIFEGSSGALGGVEAWDVSRVTNLSRAFRNTAVFNQPISGWDTAKVSVFTAMFEGAASFDQPLNDWDVTGGLKTGDSSTFNAMFKNAAAFNQPLDQWDVTGFNDTYVYYGNDRATNIFTAMFDGAVSFNQDLSGWCVDVHEAVPTNFSRDTAIINEPLWGQCGVPDFEGGIVLAYRGGEEVTLSLGGGRSIIDWGDGTYHPIAQGVVATHVLPEGDRVEVRIAGGVPSFKANGDALLEVVSFGTQPLTSLANAFEDTASLERLAVPPATVKNLNYAFQNSGGALEGLENWTNLQPTGLVATFAGATNFDRPIGGWDVSKVASFNSTFSGATSFDQPLNDWDVSGVNKGGSTTASFQKMFFGATAFNQPLDKWDVTGVEDTYYRFSTNNTNNFFSMFQGATSFAQDLSDWCVGVHNLQPANFATGAPILSEPLWGQCGRPDMSGAVVLEFEGGSEVTLLTSGKGMIDWGDGSIERITATAYESHVLPEGDRIQVKIGGGLTGFTAQSDKLLKVVTFGQEPLTTLDSAFKGAVNLESVPDSLPAGVTDISHAFSGVAGDVSGPEGWDTSGVRLMVGTFKDATSFNGDISNWDVSKVQKFTQMFSGASNFNQPLNGWDVSGAITPGYNSRAPASRSFYGMFQNASSFNQPLDSWDVSKMARRYYYSAYSGYEMTENFDLMFSGATSFAQDLADWCTTTFGTTPPVNFATGSQIINEPLWGKCGKVDMTGAVELEFEGGSEVTIVAVGSGMIDWGDGVVAGISGTSEASHVLPEGERVTVLLGGSVTGFTAQSDKLLNVASFGSQPLTSLNSAFMNASNLEGVPSALPATVKDISYAFSGVSGDISGVESWQTSGVTLMMGTFQNTPDFNGNIAGWDVSTVKQFTEMFDGAASFNQPLNGWDVSGAINPTYDNKAPASRSFYRMFRNAVSFNQPLDTWDVSKMARTYRYNVYNAANATFNLDEMFRGAQVFAQDLSSWCTTKFGNTAPNNFSTGSAILAEPVWGTCPE